MIAEKPSWIKHGGTQIFSVDIQSGGLRFATGGGDHKVRIWNMKSVSRELKADDSSQKLLATLRDHFGPVNCVRWAKHGRYIASGSDDQVILVYERKPGSGTTEFGSGEPPDVENWKVFFTLRGHTADVVDLNWSPDDLTLASGSLDNTIHIWDMNVGICTAVLRGHSSLVKGVTWDPFSSFIASQSDDKTVIIWRTSDWSVAHRSDGHGAKSLGSTFFRRLDWSPCGHFVTTTHGFHKHRHSAPVLERGEWSATFDFFGHTAPVIVAKFNHSMFRKNSSNSQDLNKSLSVGWSNGSSKTDGIELLPYNVIATGSQDRTITVWTTSSPRPLFVAEHIFSQSVVDLTWSPDGYSLFACSLDGTVATFHFDINEIGYKLSYTELDELKRNRYGDTRGRQGSLAETPTQLMLEAVSIKPTPIKKMNPVIPENQASLKPSTDLVGTTQTEENLVNDDKQTKNSITGGSTIVVAARTSSPVKQKEYRRADGRKRIIQTKNSITGGSKIVVAARTSSPVKQKGYRRADGRKRIIPEAVGGTSAAQNEGLEFHSKSSDGRNDHNGVIHSDSGVREGLKRKLTNRNSGVTARATISESLVVEKIPVSESKEGTNNVEQIGRVACGSKLVISIVDNRQGGDALPLRLEAQPRESAVNDILGAGNTSMIKETELMCTKGSVKVWSDRISGKVTILAGNSNFWAVGCEDGGLQVYTKCGRRAMPPMMIGSAAVFVDCDESWRFMLVTKNGSLYVWDLFSRKCLLHDSLASLIATNPTETGTVKIISAKLSTCGYPLVKMATRHAYLFDMSLMCWLRVADEFFPTSNYASSWNFGSSAHGGELGQLQVDVWKFLARKPAGWSRVTDDGVQTRAHLEAQMASALALKSPTEYHQSLLSYIRFLTRENDESRLREVCESFLGPPIGMAVSGSSDLTPAAWDPSVLGMDKHKLLQEDILPAMASNRKVQRLLNEFMDLLSEYNTTVTNLADENLTETNKIDTDPPQMDKVNSESTLATQTASTEPAIHATDPPSQLSDPTQLQTAPPISEQTDVDPSATDQLDAPPVVTIDGSLP